MSALPRKPDMPDDDDGNKIRAEFGINAKRSQPSQPLNDDSYTKYHFVYSRGKYDQEYLPLSKRQLALTDTDGLRMVVMDDPTSDDFLHQLQKVGQKYGWDRRLKYQKNNIHAIERMMAEPNSRMFLFQKKNEHGHYEDIGFSFVTPIRDPQAEAQGSKKTDVIDQYKKAERLPANSDAAEIYKIGLYDEFTGKGFGNYFLARVLHQIFTKMNYDMAYLDTRSTNHSGVLRFYETHGMYPTLTEVLKSDLIDGEAPEWHPSENSGSVSQVSNGIIGTNDNNDEAPNTKVDPEPSS